jgi:hypothetical protein
MDFSTLSKDQLREECTTRGIPVSGTNPELIDRLNMYEAQRAEAEGSDVDDDDLLAAASVPAPAAPAVPSTPEVPVMTTPEATAANPTSVVDPSLLPGNRYEVTFPCQSELSTGVHQDNLLRARDAAEQAGHTVRGDAAYSASRTGFRTINGVRHAVYEVPIRKE